MKYRVIGLDLDDTIADHTDVFRALTREYNITENTSPADLMTRAFNRHITRKQYAEIANRAYGEMSLESPPMPDSAEVIRGMLDAGADIHIISHRHSERSEYAKRWIEKNFPFFPMEQAHFVEAETGKDDVCKTFGVEVFMDNKPSVLDGISPDIERLLFDPHGAFKDNPLYPRITSWREFEQKTIA